MKKQLTAVLLLFVLLLTMAGCSTANAVQRLDMAEEKIEEKLDAAEEKLEDGLRRAVSPATAETLPAPISGPGPQKLTKEQAQQIALDHLGFPADQVTRLHAEYEMDDGIALCEIAFHQGDWEYEFEIHAENGTILSFDKDHKYD